ncbi:MAG: tetratricopeptide repeat protein [Bacteroidota bacterium]
MPRLSLLLFLFLLSTSLTAQVLNGKIIDGLGEEGMPNVRVEVAGFATAFSDQEMGTFSLSLPGLRPGAKIPLDIAKEGYAVINREATQPRLPDNPLDRIKIHLAPKDKRDELALSFYKINVERNIQVNFDAAAKRFAKEANYEAIGKLHSDKESALKMSDSLAARLAQFDPQMASEDITIAMQLFQKGKINEALEILDADKIINRIENRKNAINDLIEANQQDYSSLFKAADMALSALRFDEAEKYYDALIQLDTGKVENLKMIGLFFRERNLIEKALNIFFLALRQHPDEDMQVILLNEIGYSYITMNQDRKALDHLLDAKTVLEQMRNPDSIFWQSHMASCLNYIGIAQRKLNKMEESLEASETSLKLWQRLAELKPSHYLDDLATIFSNLGNGYYMSNRYQDAIHVYKESIEIRRKLSLQNPERYEYSLASSLNNLAYTLAEKLDYSRASEVYTESLKILEKLSKKDPIRYDPDFVYVLNNFALLQREMGQKAEAHRMFLKVLEVRKKLAKRSPKLYTANVAGAYNNLGLVEEDDKLGLNYFQRALEINRQVSNGQPGIEFKISMNLLNIASTLIDLDRYQESIQASEEAIEIRRNLAKNNPRRFNPYLGNSLLNYGIALNKLRKFPEAEEVFKEAMMVFESLVEGNQSRYYQNLAGTNISMAIMYYDWFVRKGEDQLIELGLSCLAQGDSYLEKCSENAFVQHIRDIYFKLEADYKKADLREIKLIQPVHSLTDSIDEAESIALKIPIQKRKINLYENAYISYPQAPNIPDLLAKSLDSLSCWQLFNNDYKEAELTARKCINLQRDYPSIHRWLAPSLLLQGKKKQATKLYHEWSDQPWPGEEANTFKEVFLSDLEKLRTIGINHPDLSHIRELLVQ